jgi:hypothetical protein
MNHCTHSRILVAMGAVVTLAALGGLMATPALAQCEHFYPQTLIGPQDPNGAESVAIGDLDGDGDGDLAISHYQVPGRLTLMFNAGDGTFPDEVTYTAGDSPERVVIGELDGQDGLDMVVVNYDSDYAMIFLNDGSGGFTPATVTVGLYAGDVAIGDLDGDGDNDLATVHPDVDLLALHLNNGDATFTAGPTYPPTEGANTPVSVAIGDLDGVNGNDIVVGTWYPWSFDQFLNNGDGTFSAQQIGTGGSCNISITIADVDGDGDNDVGSVLYWGDGAGTVSLNNGDATYATTTYWTGAYACTAVAFADLDGQSGPELLVLNRSTSTGPPGLVSVFTNDGTGHFSDRCNYEAGNTSWGLAVADLNGDSWTDAVVANNYGGCSLLLNQGAAACPGDVDGDGDTDLSDLAALLSAYGSVPGDPNWNAACDFDADDDVDLGDLAYLLSDYGCGA